MSRTLPRLMFVTVLAAGWAAAARATVKPLLFLTSASGDGYVHMAQKGEAPSPKLEWFRFQGDGKGRFELVRTELSPFKVSPNECFGGFDASTKETSPSAGAVFAIGSFDGKVGELETAFGGPETPIVASGDPVKVSFKGATFELRATGKWKQANGEKVLEGYEVTMVKQGSPGVAQRLFTQDKYQAREVTLRWAGDLDRDGQLDLVMNLNYWEGAPGVSVFLSSYAGPGGKVKSSKPQAPSFVVLAASANPEQC